MSAKIRFPLCLSVVALFIMVSAAPALSQDGDPDQPMISGIVPGPVAAVDMFIKFDGVDGESKDANHDKWIDVLSIDWGAKGTPVRATMSARRRAERSRPGRVEISDLALQKTFDKSSVALMEACANGTPLPTMIIEFTPTEPGRTPYLRYELTNVMVTSYSIFATGDVPTEQVTLNFEKVKWGYVEEGQRGKAETTWKVEEGEKMKFEPTVTPDRIEG